MQYDVLIIGAGPGGIFTTYELVTRSRKPLKVGVFEMGKPLGSRNAPLTETGLKTVSDVHPAPL